MSQTHTDTDTVTVTLTSRKQPPITATQSNTVTHSHSHRRRLSVSDCQTQTQCTDNYNCSRTRSRRPIYSIVLYSGPARVQTVCGVSVSVTVTECEVVFQQHSVDYVISTLQRMDPVQIHWKMNLETYWIISSKLCTAHLSQYSLLREQ